MEATLFGEVIIKYGSDSVLGVIFNFIVNIL